MPQCDPTPAESVVIGRRQATVAAWRGMPSHEEAPVRAFRKLRAEKDRRLTAAEIRSARFGQSPMAWRGYSEEEVSAFLSRVAAGVEADEAERAALRAEIDRLRHFYREHGADVDR